MKKKTLIIFISLVGIMLIPLFLYGAGRPSYGSGHDGCHNSEGYTIEVSVSGDIAATPSSTINFSVTATGSNLFVQLIPGAGNNDEFTILPTTDRISDDSTDDDLDPDPNSIRVVFIITTPEDDGYYSIFIIAGDDTSGQIDFAYQTIDVNIGGVSAPKPDPLAKIFDHLGLYLGLPALLLLSVATIIVLLNENKFVKLHGIFAGSAWILTIINVIAAVIKIPTQAWLGGYELIYHLPHIIFGAIGLVTGFFSMLFGIAAERKPALVTGYLTLACWWMAFITGYLLNSNLLLI